jgi:hypothetical protein
LTGFTPAPIRRRREREANHLNIIFWRTTMKKIIAATVGLLFASTGALAAVPGALHAVAEACGCCGCS